MKLLIIVFSILFVLLFIVIFLAVYLTRNKDAQNNQNETETIICEKGYFLPIDNEGDKNCLKCNIEKCI